MNSVLLRKRIDQLEAHGQWVKGSLEPELLAEVNRVVDSRVAIATGKLEAQRCQLQAEIRTKCQQIIADLEHRALWFRTLQPDSQDSVPVIQSAVLPPSKKSASPRRIVRRALSAVPFAPRIGLRPKTADSSLEFAGSRKRKRRLITRRTSKTPHRVKKRRATVPLLELEPERISHRRFRRRNADRSSKVQRPLPLALPILSPMTVESDDCSTQPMHASIDSRYDFGDTHRTKANGMQLMARGMDTSLATATMNNRTDAHWHSASRIVSSQRHTPIKRKRSQSVGHSTADLAPLSVVHLLSSESQRGSNHSRSMTPTRASFSRLPLAHGSDTNGHLQLDGKTATVLYTTSAEKRQRIDGRHSVAGSSTMALGSSPALHRRHRAYSDPLSEVSKDVTEVRSLTLNSQLAIDRSKEQPLSAPSISEGTMYYYVKGDISQTLSAVTATANSSTEEKGQALTRASTSALTPSSYMSASGSSTASSSERLYDLSEGFPSVATHSRSRSGHHGDGDEGVRCEAPRMSLAQMRGASMTELSSDSGVTEMPKTKTTEDSKLEEDTSFEGLQPHSSTEHMTYASVSSSSSVLPFDSSAPSASTHTSSPVLKAVATASTSLSQMDLARNGLVVKSDSNTWISPLVTPSSSPRQSLESSFDSTKASALDSLQLDCVCDPWLAANDLPAIACGLAKTNAVYYFPSNGSALRKESETEKECVVFEEMFDGCLDKVQTAVYSSLDLPRPIASASDEGIGAQSVTLWVHCGSDSVGNGAAEDCRLGEARLSLNDAIGQCEVCYHSLSSECSEVAMANMTPLEGGVRCFGRHCVESGLTICGLLPEQKYCFRVRFVHSKVPWIKSRFSRDISVCTLPLVSL